MTTKLAPRSYDLPQSNAPIIGWHALMPIWLKPFRSQSRYGSLGQIAILKTPAAQHHARFADFPRHGHYCLRQTVVKLSRDFANDYAALDVG